MLKLNHASMTAGLTIKMIVVTLLALIFGPRDGPPGIPTEVGSRSVAWKPPVLMPGGGEYDQPYQFRMRL